METNSDSDSKEDSVIEAKASVKFQADFKKEKFKGFYSNTQKTIIGESVDEKEENQMLKEDKDKNEDDPQFLFEEILDELTKVPVPVEKEIAVTKKIFKSYEDNSAGDETEDSECSGQEQLDGHCEDETLHQHPEFQFDQKDNVSHVTQRTGTLEETEETKNINTSSEEEEDDEDQGSRKLSFIKEEGKMTYGSSEESDVAVGDLDYYKIRHETEFVEENQFRLKPSTITLNQSMDGRKTGERRCSIPHIKVIRNAEDDMDTDDEDISCLESDFMTKEEFFEAHKTNYDLTKKQVALVVSYSFSEKSDETPDDDDEVTEYDSDITDEDDQINLPEEFVHSPGCRFSVTSTKDVNIHIETTESDNYDNVDHSEFEKSTITEMDDTDHTEEDPLTDMEEDNSKGENLAVTKSNLGKDINQLHVINKTLSPRVKKNKKKRNRRQ